MKLFVTGATGFVGSHFVQTALNDDVIVTAIRRDPRKSSVIPLQRS